MRKKSPRTAFSKLTAIAWPDIAMLLAVAQEASLQGDGTRAMTALHDAYLNTMKVNATSMAADALYMLARQARLNNDTAASIPFANLIFELPERGRASTRFKGYLAIAHHLSDAGRDAEVLSTLRDAQSEDSFDTLAEFCDYLSLRGCAEAMQGH